MKFYKNLGQALQREIIVYSSMYPEEESTPLFGPLSEDFPLPRYDTKKATEMICDYCCGKNNWYMIKSEYIENEPHISLDYEHNYYYVDKKTGFVLIKVVNEYDYLCLYPAILFMERMESVDYY